MARPQRNNVDYFPHPVDHGKKMSYIEKKYKNDGYATWFKILEELGDAEYHYLDLSDEVQFMFLSDKCLVSEDVLLSIINDLVRLKEFDKKLWNDSQILFNEKFVESVKDAYKKRSNECVTKKSLLLLLDSLGISKLLKSNPKPEKSSSQGVIKPQRKEKDRIEEERDAHALKAFEFIKREFPIRFEEDFKIKFSNKIQNKEKFIDDFNDTVDLEEIEFSQKKLFARLSKYSRNWIENQNKFKNPNSQDNNSSYPVPIG